MGPVIPGATGEWLVRGRRERSPVSGAAGAGGEGYEIYNIIFNQWIEESLIVSQNLEKNRDIR